MNSSRPFSHASSSRSSSKPSFQKKLKPRIRGLSNIQDQFNFSTDLNKFSTTQPIILSFQNKSQVLKIDNKEQNEDNLQFNQTSNRLSQINFGNHCSDECVCNDCSCGRHLCKFNNIKPDLTKNTIYKIDFLRKSYAPNKIIKAQQYQKLNGPHLDMKSTQRFSFTPRQGDRIERPIPEDLLKSSGPVPNLTTYKSLYPGYRGLNQYVKPTNLHTREKFPLRCKSTYTESFMNKSPLKKDYKYMKDMLKTGGKWFGSSSYENQFSDPNPEYQAKKVRLVEKYHENPNFAHQYETVYKNDFIQKQSVICGAKINLETRLKGRFNETKGSFGENTDFKSMSPQYQAFSTSKFSFA